MYRLIEYVEEHAVGLTYISTFLAIIAGIYLGIFY
ncbi:hypothetical protein VMF7928_03865 [Vibrio marisflavi CECT 7928]|uniref:Uncharacterized protein n=1 Tax=Vibrio marisflavi CECT 7928 TaxID=634439 RepID=A0ABN8E8K6_9VIBR|nr:hypothetical protein VMF7928_03865 [Vibrio marisflavi CECT 7928]